MDTPCTPAIATAALFMALLFLDLFRREFHLLPSHGILGVFSVLLMSVLCNNNGELAAWGIFAIPFIILLIGWMSMVSQQDTGIPYRIGPVNPAKNPCAVCRKSVDVCRCQKRTPSPWM